MQIREIYSFNYENITIYIDIDYQNNKISLVEKNTFKEKKWLFAGRGLDYMQSWKNILDAMSMAIVEAEGKMKAFQEEQARRLAERVEEASKRVDEDLINKKK